MKIILENLITVAALILSEAWFLSGYFAGNPEYEPAIVFIAALGVLLSKDPIKRKFGIDNNSRSHDQSVFQKFSEIFPAEPTLRFLKEHDFGGSFRRANIKSLNDFVETWDSIENEFLNKKLEKKKKELYSKAEKLATEIARRTVPLSGGELSSVYSDNLRNAGGPRPKHVIEDAIILNEIATEFVPKYEEFVRFCRKVLSR